MALGWSLPKFSLPSFGGGSTPQQQPGNPGGAQKWYDWIRGQGGAGNPTPVGGYQGGKMGFGTPVQDPYHQYGSSGYEGMPPEARDSIERARQRLAAGQYAGSTFGQTLQGRYSNSYGYKPDTRRRLEVEAEERMAGRLANSKENARLMANSRGASDTAGLLKLLADIETGTARDLNSEMTNIAQRDEELGLQRELGSAGYLAQLFGLEAAGNQAAAQFEGGIEWPIGGSGGPGGTPPWAQEGQPVLLNENGEMDFNKIYGMGGDRDWLMQIARQQREAYEQWKQASVGG